jgi:hypothetical protein
VKGFARLGVVALLFFGMAAGCQKPDQVSVPLTPTTTTPAPATNEPSVDDPWEFFHSCYFENGTPPCPPIVATVTLTGDEATDEPRVVPGYGITITGLKHEEGCGVRDGVPHICWKHWRVTWKYDLSKVVPLPSMEYYRSIGGWRWGASLDANNVTELNSKTVRALRIYARPNQPDPATQV